MTSSEAFPVIGSPSSLLIHRLLDRSSAWAPSRRIVYRDLFSCTYPEFRTRVHQLAAALTRLGVRQGDRIGVLDWDSHRYLECFFAIPMIGAVLHTINTRLAPDQILYTIDHAGDRFLLCHPDFLPVINPLKERMPAVEGVVLLPDEPPTTPCAWPALGNYEELLARESAPFAFPEFDEQTPATLFYTTGTTGDPKGVFFSHRQIVVHSLAAGLALTSNPEPVPLRADDTYLPLTPMFHVHAWGVPYIATLLGLGQVYPGRFEASTCLRLIRTHQVTFSHCVPTLLQMLLHHPDAQGFDWSRFKVIIGGAALPRGLASLAMKQGMRVMAGYGMSETCPIVSLAQVKPEDAALSVDDHLDILTRAGFPIPLAEAALVDAEDRPVDPRSGIAGELVLRAPWLTPGYFRDPERSRQLWRTGWLHTGDIAVIDPAGYLRITDRLKDVIKISGEWISSLELENALSQHPAVREVAVIGLPDPKWDERPHAEVVLKEGFTPAPTAKDLHHFLRTFVDRGLIHKRAILTEVHFVPSIPKTSVGKVNKRAMRQDLGTTHPKPA
ncbi:MAG: fatty acid--CoA ligase [Verrucomicrobiales bacterium]|nr:fatty acid--CoA ligase [Verrucomicrobiales bacterium]